MSQEDTPGALPPQNYPTQYPRVIESSTGFDSSLAPGYSDDDINGVMSGSAWTGGELFFSFPTQASDYDGEEYSDQNALSGIQPFTEAQQNVVRYALGLVAQYTNLTFTEIAPDAEEPATLRLAGSSAPETSYAYLPGLYDSAGDVWLGSVRNVAPDFGTYAFDTILHEIGHALGLKHGHEVSDGDSATVFPVLPTEHDSSSWSIMDYRPYLGGPLYFTSAPGSSSLTYMVNDIAALQYLYGANYATNAGNTVYGWNPDTGAQLINGVVQPASITNTVYQSVWDGGGIDTYDLSNYATNLTLDLRAGAWSTFSQTQIAKSDFRDAAVRAPGNLVNSLPVGGNLASLIENATGGAGNDRITGNLLDNVLRGNGGNDTLDGGAGSDTAWFSGLFSDYWFTRLAANWIQVADQRSGAPDGSDTALDFEALRFSDLTHATANAAPVLTTSNLTRGRGQTLALSSLLSVSDADSDTIRAYELWDSTRDAASGHFEVNGVAQAAGTVIHVSAAQVAQTSFVTGTVGDNLQIRALDWLDWSADDTAAWAPFTVTVPANRAPVVTTADTALLRGQNVALTSLFHVSDADEDAITRYQVWDSTRDAASGSFTVGGVAQAAGTVIDITAAQMATARFTAGTFTGDRLQIRAFDGLAWSAGDNDSWAPFAVTVPENHAPVVTSTSGTVKHGTSLALLGVLAINDADRDAITRYQLWDGTLDPASGHFVVDGVAQAAGTVIDISATQMRNATYIAGTVGDNLQIRAFDGAAWSAGDNDAWAPFRVDVAPNTAPVVTTANLTRSAGRTMAASSLFSVSDADSDAMTAYELWDGTTDPNSGHFVVDGVVQAAGPTIHISAAQLATTSFVAGSTVGDRIQIRAFDGSAWSAGNTEAWSPFRLDVAPNAAPVVTTANLTRGHNESFAVGTLFSVSDTNGDTMRAYELWDGTTDANSGHFTVDGVAQAAGPTIHITAAQLGTTSFVTGASGSDRIQIRAFDGSVWSAAENVAWAPFRIDVAPNHAPVVTTSDKSFAQGHVVAAADLFTVSDADSDAMTAYELWDGTTDPNSGHFVVDGVVQAAGPTIHITAGQLATTSFTVGSTGDRVQIRAFDGGAWSAGDTVAWSPFHIAVGTA